MDSTVHIGFECDKQHCIPVKGVSISKVSSLDTLAVLCVCVCVTDADDADNVLLNAHNSN